MFTFRSIAAAVVVSLTCAGASGQSVLSNPDWRESSVGSPPAFDVKRLLFIESPVSSSLKFGVDPATLSITPEGVVRYVMVALGQDGAQNVLYEGIRCNTAEYRLYAMHSPEKGWTPSGNPEWQPLKGSAATRHGLLLALAAVCTGRTPTTPVGAIVNALRTGVAPGTNNY